MERLSIYNNYVKLDSRIIVYNTKYGNAVSFENDSVEEVQSHIMKSRGKDFIDLGFLTDEQELEETKKQFYEMKYSHKKLYIMLIMTYDCNCKCSYCFESLNNDLLSITDEKIDVIIDYIISMYRNGGYENLEIQYFGGEPTLKIDKIIYTQNRLKSSGIDFISNVITNGTLLTPRVVEKLYDCDIRSFQITLDGPKHIHDKRRPMKNNLSCWEQIMDNLNNISQEDISINIRINIDSENVGFIKQIYDLLPSNIKTHPFASIYIAPIVGCKLNTFQETMNKRISNIKQAWAEIKENNLPIPIIPPVYAPCPYDSYDSAFYIDLLGNVYTCGGFVGKDYKIERVMDKQNMKFWNRINDNPKESCFACSFFPICMGGCKFEEEQLGSGCQRYYLKEIYDEFYSKYQDE